ncbi:MAG: 7TM domain-containing protein [Thermoguttaceae bacterium]
MTAKGATFQVVLVLLVAGACSVAVRRNYRGSAEAHPGDTGWRLTYTAGFHARTAAARVRAAIPENTHHSRVFKHEIAGANLPEEPQRAAQAARSTEIVLRPPKPGQYEVQVRFDIQLSTRAWAVNPEAPLSPEHRAKCLGSEKGVQVDDATVSQTVERLRAGEQSLEDLVRRLFEYCVAEIMVADQNAAQDAAAALTTGRASPLGQARAFVALCRASKVPARLVTGFEIREVRPGNEVHPHVWVEALPGRQWLAYDVENAFAREVPRYFVPVHRGPGEIIRVSDATDVTTKYSIAPMPLPPAPPPGPLRVLDLEQLPDKLQRPMELLLLVPLGALVTAFFRTIVGVRTFGTFTPTLLALAFVYNRWQTGLPVVAAVLFLGLSSRRLLDGLKLLLVPRLGIILTLVVLLMVFSVSVMYHFGHAPAGETVLLPMVILTMLVERFFITTEEDNLRFALQLLLATAVLALLVYWVLYWRTVGQVLLAYPELHCFTIAGLILIGRYTGYRWTELLRFRDLPEGRD